ncbi:MAG: site-2 protease family protein [Defluviitaleaceae bacterium]|nr:site-2 protease family protein [Defluviitaleaceae bacterium]
MIPIITLVTPFLAAILVIFLKEFSKAVTCSAFGDKSIKNTGRLSLNPLKHIEPIGLILFFQFGTLGWGKPIETRNQIYRSSKNAVIISSLVPMVILILTGIVSSFLINTLPPLQTYLGFFWLTFLFQTMRFSFGLFIFNLIPLYPFEASRILKLFMSPNQSLTFSSNERMYLFILVFAFFLLPGHTNAIFSNIVSLMIAFFTN